MTSQAAIRHGCTRKHTLVYGVETTGESHDSFDSSNARVIYKILVLCSTSLKKMDCWDYQTDRAGLISDAQKTPWLGKKSLREYCTTILYGLQSPAQYNLLPSTFTTVRM